MISKRNKPQFLLKRWVFALVFVLLGLQTVMAATPSTFTTPVTCEQEIHAVAVQELPAPVSFIGQGQGTPAAEPEPQVQVGVSDMIATLTVVVLILLAIVVLLIFVSINLASLIRIRDGQEGYTLSGTLSKTMEKLKNPYINSAVGFVSVIVALFFVVPEVRSIGHSQGYKPEQPIKFSHKTHAGEFQIDCQYCHSGASKGKNAWIPSANVCMNCHKGIKEGRKYGTKEIQKIYDAVEKNQPIKWVRIHNLPDFVYFNHQQHVVAGKQECQTCHGKIEEMDVVYQYNVLSMGWCVNCHRETEVDQELYQKQHREGVVHVEDIGGLECARCHY